MPSFALRVRALAALAVIAAQSLAGAALAQGKFDKLYVFGDSLSDTGNVLSTTAGSNFVTQRPTNPYYDTGRWTNGSSTNGQAALNLANSAYTGVWHEVLAARLGLPLATNSLGGGTNYAYGGATTAGGGSNYTKNIGFQVNSQYLANNPSFDSRHLYCIWGGGNDVRDAANSIFWTAASVNTAAATAVTNIEGYITSIANAAPVGTRINVIWPNIPPLQSIPDFITAPANKRAALETAAQTFQLDELNAVDRITSGNPNVQIHVVDILDYFNDLLAGNLPGLNNLNTTDPILNFNSFGGLGFSPTRNGAVPNGANPDQYVFWDKVHPTAMVQDLIGKLAEQSIPAPSVAGVFVLGAMVATQRRRAG